MGVEGAHSFGKVHEEVSMSIYSWTRMQEKLLNNQQFRSLVNEPMYKTVCKKKNPLFLIGDSDGEPCETDWQVQARGYSVGGGPYQWFSIRISCINPKYIVDFPPNSENKRNNIELLT